MAASRSRPAPGAGSRSRQLTRSSVVATPRHFRAFGIMEAGNIVRSLPGDKATRYGSRRDDPARAEARRVVTDRKSTRLNSSHRCISYAVFCLKKKKQTHIRIPHRDNRKPTPTQKTPEPLLYS